MAYKSAGVVVFAVLRLAPPYSHFRHESEYDEPHYEGEGTYDDNHDFIVGRSRRSDKAAGSTA